MVAFVTGAETVGELIWGRVRGVDGTSWWREETSLVGLGSSTVPFTCKISKRITGRFSCWFLFLNVGCMIHKRIQIKEYVETVEGIYQSDSLRARHNTLKGFIQDESKTHGNKLNQMNMKLWTLCEYARGEIFSPKKELLRLISNPNALRATGVLVNPGEVLWLETQIWVHTRCWIIWTSMLLKSLVCLVWLDMWNSSAWSSVTSMDFLEIQ